MENESSNNNKSISIISTNSIKDKIYTIRGIQVMLDSDLAEIYGYSTKAFNQQVKNNIERFDEDFMFQLSDEEVKDLRSKILTTNISSMSRSNPYAFTEQGIYMLMTVLKGELAVSQSKMLVRLFKQMKDYIVENQQVIGQRDFIRLSLQAAENLSFHQLCFLLEKMKPRSELVTNIMIVSLFLIIRLQMKKCILAELHQKMQVRKSVQFQKCWIQIYFIRL